jgi:ABC-2 type transport system ATP-binding protein
VDAVIRTEGLTKRFGATVALDDLTLGVERGEVLGYLGPNGAGKTTTTRLLLGLLRPTAGTASILGLDPWADTVELHARLAYVPGELAVWPQLTGGQMLDLLGALHGSVDPAYRDELCQRFEFDPSKKGRSYSKGNRQKVGLIAALMTRAEILILDEPTAGLDPLMEMTFRGCVGEAREHGQTIFLSSHILSEVEAVCDRVAILRQGRLADLGTLESLRAMSAREVEVRFDGSVPDLTQIPGVTAVRVEDGTARVQVRGSADPLIKALATHEVAQITAREPSLEEVFLTYYGDEG